VKTRYAEARPDAAAIIAAKLQGGSILNLLAGDAQASRLWYAAQKNSRYKVGLP
jgi:hypothetical protein